MTLLPVPLQRLLPALILAGLSGCAIVPQPPQRPPAPPVPTAWQGDAAQQSVAPLSTPETPWWQTLQDRQLDALQSLALETNVDALRKALAWRSAQTQARLTALSQQPTPSLTFNTNTNRSLQSGDSSVIVNGVSIPVETTRTARSYGASAGLSYEWDLWSKLSQATQVDRIEAEIRREDWLSARWLVSTNVAEAYWSIAAIDAKIPILNELSQAVDEALRIAQARLREGKLRADEVNVVVTKQYDVRKRIADAQADRRLRLNELALLLDREASSLPFGEARLPAGEPSEPALGTPAETLERRPDVRQARLAVDAALARLYVAEASRYPALNMNISLSTNGRQWREWFSQPLASLGLSLAVPLVDWRRLDANRDVARNTLEDSALALRASVRQALTDVQNELLERERWQKGWQAAAMQTVEKEKIYAIARVRQDVGVFGRLDVLQSREGVLQAQLDTIDLRLQAWLNLLKLYKALGGAV